MNRKQLILLAITLALIGSTGGLLAHIRDHPRLGAPGVKSHPLPDGVRVEVDLPERVQGFSSEYLPQAEIVTNTLPKDTSFGQRLYQAPDGFQATLNVVLMGRDRTSLHKPQYCLEGQGWRINPNLTQLTTIHVDQPHPYELPVLKLVANKEAEIRGQKTVVSAVYVYWFVADGAISAGQTGAQRMWWMFKELIRTGILQRWAYVSCLSITAPGQEEAAFERMKHLIAAAVPQFQLTPTAAPGDRTAHP